MDSFAARLNELPDVIARFQCPDTGEFRESLERTGSLFVTGSETCRHLPSGILRYWAMRCGHPVSVQTENPRQAGEYDLTASTIVCIFDGPAEPVFLWLLERLSIIGHEDVFALTTDANSSMTSLVRRIYPFGISSPAYEMTSGLFLQCLLAQMQGRTLQNKLGPLSDAMQSVIQSQTPAETTKALAECENLYVIGRTDGVAADIVLKWRSLLHRRSVLLPGTEVFVGGSDWLTSNDAILLVNPFRTEIERLGGLAEESGITMIAISDEDVPFDTIKVPDIGELAAYVYLAAGWKLIADMLKK